MPTFTGKTFSSFYKNILGINQSSNTGVDASAREIQDGAGNNTCLSVSTRAFQVQPAANSIITSTVKNTNGGNILAVDTANGRVLCGSSQVNALLHYKEFGGFSMAQSAGYHRILASSAFDFKTTGMSEISMGNGDDPASTLDISAETDTTSIAPLYWRLTDAITIMAVDVLVGGSTVSSGTLPDVNFQLWSYDMDTSTNHGDLSGGERVAGTAGPTGNFLEDIHEDNIKYQTLAGVPTDVAAGKIILAMVESTTGDDISVNMIVKYHIQ